MGEELPRVGHERLEQEYSVGVRCTVSLPRVTKRRAEVDLERAEAKGRGRWSRPRRRKVARARASSSSIANGFVT